jgi:SmpA / OmlA family.
MKKPLYALVVVLLMVACSKVNQENFLKVQEGMSEEEVISLLGRPTESNSVNVLGVSGTASRWIARDTEITVRFVNGKVAFKSFDKAGGKGKPEGK